MSFSLPRFVRRTPAASFARYFVSRGIPLPETLKWDAPPRALAAKLLDAIEKFERVDHDRVIADFERIDQLCNDIGQRTIQSLVAFAGKTDLLARLHAADSNETRSIMMLLDDRILFDHALAASYAIRLRNGRSWSAFGIPPSIPATAESEQLAALESDVAKLFKQFDGSGRNLKIERFVHRTSDREAKSIGLTILHTIYAEGLPESQDEFEERELKPRTRRPVHEGAISCDPERKVLDVISRGGQPIRRKLAHFYARHILGVTHDLRPVLERSFQLDRLKRHTPFPTDPADGLKSVRVTLLRLRDTAGGNGCVTLETDEPDGEDVYTLSARWFGDADPLQITSWRVTRAKLQDHLSPRGRAEKRDKSA